MARSDNWMAEKIIYIKGTIGELKCTRGKLLSNLAVFRLSPGESERLKRRRIIDI